jgi:hypothetical protein
MEHVETAFVILSCQIGFGVILIVWLTDRIEKRVNRVIAMLEATQHGHEADLKCPACGGENGKHLSACPRWR